MSTNDTIITIARRVSEKSPLDNWLLMVRYSKSEDVLKIMMATDKDIHLKSIIKINMYTFSLKQRYIEINKMNTVYTANISTNCSLSTWFTVKRRTTYSITSNANPMKHCIRKSLCTFLTKHPKISIRISMCTKISQQQTHIVKGWAIALLKYIHLRKPCFALIPLNLKNDLEHLVMQRHLFLYFIET